eukprot:GHVU01129227.1.p1 GENE.GHVU01129227.1~~GHVU01129227.1.p1  ORF type:complete len:689 (+),score=147.13 GHVU01129227.1:197-2068(+)
MVKQALLDRQKDATLAAAAAAAAAATQRQQREKPEAGEGEARRRRSRRTSEAAVRSEGAGVRGERRPSSSSSPLSSEGARGRSESPRRVSASGAPLAEQTVAAASASSVCSLFSSARKSCARRAQSLCGLRGRISHLLLRATGIGGALEEQLPPTAEGTVEGEPGDDDDNRWSQLVALAEGLHDHDGAKAGGREGRAAHSWERTHCHLPPVPLIKSYRAKQLRQAAKEGAGDGSLPSSSSTPSDGSAASSSRRSSPRKHKRSGSVSSGSSLWSSSSHDDDDSSDARDDDGDDDDDDGSSDGSSEGVEEGEEADKRRLRRRRRARRRRRREMAKSPPPSSARQPPEFPEFGKVYVTEVDVVGMKKPKKAMEFLGTHRRMVVAEVEERRDPWACPASQAIEKCCCERCCCGGDPATSSLATAANSCFGGSQPRQHVIGTRPARVLEFWQLEGDKTNPVWVFRGRTARWIGSQSLTPLPPRPQRPSPVSVEESQSPQSGEAADGGGVGDSSGTMLTTLGVGTTPQSDPRLSFPGGPPSAAAATQTAAVMTVATPVAASSAVSGAGASTGPGLSSAAQLGVPAPRTGSGGLPEAKRTKLVRWGGGGETTDKRGGSAAAGRGRRPAGK